MSHEVALFDRHSGGAVRATLIERIDVGYARRADSQWLTFLNAEIAHGKASGVPIRPPEHARWEWEKKVALTGHLLLYPTMAIEHEGTAQGLMLLQTDGEFARLPAELGKPLVHAMFLASAPWNLSTVVARPRFKGVGTTLLRAATEVSLDLGFKGRIGLHSLPQADDFYLRLGMTPLGKDPTKQDLIYYEMSPAQAAQFLK